MNTLLRRAGIGAIIGGSYAFVVDLRGYFSAPSGEPFNWRLCLATVASGIIMGGSSGLGGSVVGWN